MDKKNSLLNSSNNFLIVSCNCSKVLFKKRMDKKNSSGQSSHMALTYRLVTSQDTPTPLLPLNPKYMLGVGIEP